MDDSKNPIDLEMVLLAATENLVGLLRDLGLNRTQAWDYILNLTADEATEPIRRAQFDLVWPEEEKCP